MVRGSKKVLFKLFSQDFQTVFPMNNHNLIKLLNNKNIYKGYSLVYIFYFLMLHSQFAYFST